MNQMATDHSAQDSRVPVLRIVRDRADRHHFALAREAPDAASAWDANVRWLLHTRVLDPSAPGFLLGCLLLLDAVACDFDLRAAWVALADAYRDGRSCCIEWLDAYFSPSWTAFQADRGQDFSVIVDGVSD